MPMLSVKPLTLCCCIAFICALLLPAFSLAQSRYLPHCLPVYLLLLACSALLVLLVRHVSRRRSTTLLAMGAASLLTGNLAHPMMWFVCGDDTTAAIRLSRMQWLPLLVIAAALTAWCGLSLMEQLRLHAPQLECAAVGAVCLAAAAIVLLLGGKTSNTSAIDGLQPASLMAFLLLYCYSAALGRQQKRLRLLYLGMCLLLLAVLACKKEYGFPLLLLLTFLLYYLLLYPLPKLEWLLPVCGGVLLLGALLFLREPALRQDVLGKLATRMRHNDQLESVLENIRQTSLLGNPLYKIRVSEAGTDFALATSLHFFGYLWFVLSEAMLALGGFLVLREEAVPHGFTPTALMRGLTVLFLLVMNGYNAGMSVGLLPIIGIQSPFCGRSFGFAILSGLLLGSACCHRGSSAVPRVPKTLVDYRSLKNEAPSQSFWGMNA